MHTDFLRAFTTGSRFWDPRRDVTYTTEVLAVGELAMPTGVLMVQDPGYLMDGMEYEVLSRRVPIGVWPAEVTVARTTGSEGLVHGTVAAMRLRFSDAASNRWEAALSDDSGRALGFGVDGGRIAIFDRAVLDRSLCEGIVNAVDLDQTRPASIVSVPVRETAELFVSDSGLGDGAYPAWWGLDATGAVTELIVEFDVLIRGTYASIGVPAELLRERGPVFTPDLLVAGVDLEVLGGDDVPRQAGSTGLALRVREGVANLELHDARDRPVGVNPGVIGPFPDGTFVRFWADDPRVARAHTLAVEIFTGREPLGPPPAG